MRRLACSHVHFRHSNFLHTCNWFIFVGQGTTPYTSIKCCESRLRLYFLKGCSNCSWSGVRLSKKPMTFAALQDCIVLWPPRACMLKVFWLYVLFLYVCIYKGLWISTYIGAITMISPYSWKCSKTHWSIRSTVVVICKKPIWRNIIPCKMFFMKHSHKSNMFPSETKKTLDCTRCLITTIKIHDKVFFRY